MQAFRVNFRPSFSPLQSSVILHALVILGVALVYVYRGSYLPVSSFLSESERSIGVSLVANQTQVQAQEQPQKKIAAVPVMHFSSTIEVRDQVVQSQSSADRGALTTAPAIASATTTVESTLADHFAAALRAEIENNKLYPSSARALGQQGRVVVGFTLTKNGQIEAIRVVERSLYERLNQAAVLTVSRLGSFRPIPQELDRDQWEFIIPIEFKLN